MAVLFLQNFNGSDGDTTPPADAVAGITWVRGANGELDTAIKKFGSASWRIPSVPGGAISAHATGFSDVKSSTYTIEGWIYFVTNTSALIRLLEDSTNRRVQMEFSASADNVAAICESDSSEFINTSAGATINTGTWYHWAIVRNAAGGTYSWFFNGNRVIHVTSGTNPESLTDFEVASGSNSEVQFDGLRLSDTVEYSGATYTVPTAEFGAIEIASTGAVAFSGEATLSFGIEIGSTGAVAFSGTSDLSTGILLGSTGAAAFDGAISLGTDANLESTGAVAFAGVTDLLTGIPLASSAGQVAFSGEVSLHTPVSVTLVQPEGAEAAPGERTKPAIPLPSGLPLGLVDILDPIKENIEIITGRRGGKIALLPDTATDADVIAKINEVITRLQS